mgnify:CR=1 FL=1
MERTQDAAQLIDRTVAIVAKFDPSPREVIAQDYDAGLASMTEEGTVSHEVLKEEVATRAELIKLGQPPDVALAPRGDAVAHPVLLVDDPALELVAFELFFLERLIAPGLEFAKAAVEQPRAPAIKPERLA